MSAAENQRAEISLNGKWDFTPRGGARTRIDVPDYWDAKREFAGVAEAVYERDVAVPEGADWRGKILRVEFEGVNFIADVSVDGKPAGSHVGGWIPFGVDVTRFAAPGASFRLRVAVKGGNHEPVVDSAGAPLMPVGFVGQRGKWGIAFDVRLRAFGETSARDVFVRTSVRGKKLEASCEIENAGKEARTVKVVGRVAPAAAPGEACLALESGPVTVKAGGTAAVELAAGWPEPRLWSPADPWLYRLFTEVVDAKTGEAIDKRRDRFGFREVWTEGNRLVLNGRRLTLLGANIVQHSEFYDNQRYHFVTPETWHRTVDRLFDLNLRAVRFHMQPAPPFVLDAADERGLLVIEESAIYARDYMRRVNMPVYLENCRKWIAAWVRARRNHPSVVVWNAENEMLLIPEFSCMTAEELKSLGDAIRRHDRTRPVNYDGDGDVGDALVNLHYPETYMGTVSGSIYAWAEKVRPDKPTGVGEFLTHYGKNGQANQWWQGTWVRGMRYAGFADIRPYRHDWALLRSDDTPCIENLRNSLSPVALFDKEYDDLGIDPLVNRNYPELQAGETARRTLVLYNEEFAGEVIDVEVLVKSSAVYQALYHYVGDRAPVQKIVAQGSATYVVPLGERVEIPCSFEIPRLRESPRDFCDLELIARKNGEVKFRETKRFSLRKSEFRDETSSVVTLGPAAPLP
jgi:hypothetical protein